MSGLAEALDRVVLELPASEREDLARRGREHALAFDRKRVFDDLFPVTPGPSGALPGAGAALR